MNLKYYPSRLTLPNHFSQTGLTAVFPQMLTRNSLKLSLKIPRFYKNSLDFHKAVCYFHPIFDHF